jgi:hypothetical protein
LNAAEAAIRQEQDPQFQRLLVLHQMSPWRYFIRTSDVWHAGSPNRGAKGKPNPKTKMHTSGIDVDLFV